jgi:hypothetical protein
MPAPVPARALAAAVAAAALAAAPLAAQQIQRDDALRCYEPLSTEEAVADPSADPADALDGGLDRDVRDRLAPGDDALGDAAGPGVAPSDVVVDPTHGPLIRPRTGTGPSDPRAEELRGRLPPEDPAAATRLGEPAAPVFDEEGDLLGERSVVDGDAEGFVRRGVVGEEAPPAPSEAAGPIRTDRIGGVGPTGGIEGPGDPGTGPVRGSAGGGAISGGAATGGGSAPD